MKKMIEEIGHTETQYSFIWDDPKKESKALRRYVESEARQALSTCTS